MGIYKMLDFSLKPWSTLKFMLAPHSLIYEDCLVCVALNTFNINVRYVYLPFHVTLLGDILRVKNILTAPKIQVRDHLDF